MANAIFLLFTFLFKAQVRHPRLPILTALPTNLLVHTKWHHNRVILYSSQVKKSIKILQKITKKHIFTLLHLGCWWTCFQEAGTLFDLGSRSDCTNRRLRRHLTTDQKQKFDDCWCRVGPWNKKPQIIKNAKFCYFCCTYPSQDSSIGSISAWYWGGSGFKFRQGRVFQWK